MEDDIWSKHGKPKPKKKKRFCYSRSQEQVHRDLDGLPSNNKALLDNGKTVLYTCCIPVNWEDGDLPDDAIYLGEGFVTSQLDNLDSETMLEEINKLLD